MIFDIEKVIVGYKLCALWLATDEDGSSVDDLELSDFDPDDDKQIREDCTEFLAGIDDESLMVYWALGQDSSDFGHDFYLTRNGHGTGFWDRSYAVGVHEHLVKISDAAKVYGETYYCIGTAIA